MALEEIRLRKYLLAEIEKLAPHLVQGPRLAYVSTEELQKMLRELKAKRNPIAEGQLAVVKRGGMYKDLDSGDKDILHAGTVVRTLFKRGSSWVIDCGPGMNTLLVPQSSLTGFIHPERAEKRYKPGHIWSNK